MKSTEREVVPIIGTMATTKEDLDEDIFDLDGIAFSRFVNEGYLSGKSKWKPRLQDIIGHPTAVWIEDMGGLSVMRLRGTVWYPPLVELFKAKEQLGLALAGVIEVREGNVIKQCTITSVAIVPVEELSDPNCVCQLDVGEGIK